MLVAILTITFGALGVTGGLQELVVQGIGNNLLVPLVGGTLGVVCSGLIVAAGIAQLRDTPRAPALTRAADTAVESAAIQQRCSRAAAAGRGLRLRRGIRARGPALARSRLAASHDRPSGPSHCGFPA